MASFTARDLANILPDEVDSYSLQHTKDDTGLKAEDVDEFKPKIDPTKKVKRYIAGQVPSFEQDEDDEDSFFTSTGAIRHAARKEAEVERPSRAKVEAQIVDEPVPTAPESEEEHDDGLPVVGTMEDEDLITSRRARMRARRQQLEEEEEEEFGMDDATGGEEVETEEVWQGIGEPSSEESEYETDTDESDDETQIAKPVFVPKGKRGTIADIDAERLREEQKQKAKEAAAERRKIETRNLVAEQVRREETEADANDGNNSEDGMPSDTDDLDDPFEYEAWRLRDLRRLQRDKEERESFEKERLETERRRKLTDAEREAEDKALGKNAPKEKAKWSFMQKYYHKGAFYMDETEMGNDDVRKRDYGDATLEDKFDKEALPKVMQVKKFGFAGQTKYTHLADQDTTDWDNPWMQRNDNREKVDSKLAGLGDIDGAGRKRSARK